jgi:hypothetical protein
VTSDSQACLLPERCDQGDTALHGFEPVYGKCLHFADRVAAQIGQFVLLGVGPDIFRRVQLGRIAGQVFHHDRPIGRRQIIRHHCAAVSRQSIPDDEQLAANLFQQAAQEVHNLLFLDGTLHKAKVKLTVAQRRNRRQMRPVKAVPQQRRLAFGRPGSRARGSFAQPGFINEENGSPLSAGFFLTSASACASIPESLFRHAGWLALSAAGKRTPGL